MKQVLQNIRTGETEVAELPCPSFSREQILIRTTRTLLSAGTERMMVEFGKAGWIDKARQQPDKVRMVLQKVRTDGLLPTVDAVLNKLDEPLALGYCNVGTVMDAGANVRGFAPGDRVISNGKHAEVVSVGANLCAHIPANVSDDEAAFTVLGAIGLQGIRLANPTLGESFVVTGLGLIGLLTVQLLRAHGCRVLGIDYDGQKLQLAAAFGAEVVDLSSGEDPVNAAEAFSRGRGVDGVLITAATSSSEPVHQAAVMCRKRGRIVLVGVTGLELSRADFYEKELSFQVSCSYGPGRYEKNYEEKGLDYPVGFVRWTEQRNFEAVLDLMSDGRLDVEPLITHRFPIARAEEAYRLIAEKNSALGILLDYPGPAEKSDAELRRSELVLPVTSQPRVAAQARSGTERTPSIGLIGSGNYARAILLPALKNSSVRLVSVASSAGVSGVHAARKFGFETTTTNAAELFDNPDIDTLVISTRHNTHAPLVVRALDAGKNVFVEKPLALTLDELDEIRAVYEAQAKAAAPILMVGFNRRFAPHVVQMRKLLRSVSAAKAVAITVNAGAIPPNHWTQDPAVGGGRIVGEACHFVDLARFLVGRPIIGLEVTPLGGVDATAPVPDRVSATLRFADGSVATILYLSNGHRSFPKERVEVFSGGRVLQLDNFRKLTGYGWSGFSSKRLFRQDKGQRACVEAFVRAVKAGGPSPIPFDELMEVSRVSIEVAAGAERGLRHRVDDRS